MEIDRFWQNTYCPADQFLFEWRAEITDPRIRVRFAKRDDRLLELYGLAVDNPHDRGKGLGTALMEQITEVADRVRVDLLLYPDDANRDRLRRFYVRFGFFNFRIEGSMLRRGSQFVR